MTLSRLEFILSLPAPERVSERSASPKFTLKFAGIWRSAGGPVYLPSNHI
jgi:hypothetical protein